MSMGAVETGRLSNFRRAGNTSAYRFLWKAAPALDPRKRGVPRIDGRCRHNRGVPEATLARRPGRRTGWTRTAAFFLLLTAGLPAMAILSPGEGGPLAGNRAAGTGGKPTSPLGNLTGPGSGPGPWMSLYMESWKRYRDVRVPAALLPANGRPGNVHQDTAVRLAVGLAVRLADLVPFPEDFPETPPSTSSSTPTGAPVAEDPTSGHTPR